MNTFTFAQLNALAVLSDALLDATESGLFDNVDIHPDVINNFCDAITEVLEDLKK